MRIRREYDREYYRTHKAEKIEYAREYNKTHKEKCRIYEKRYGHRIKAKVFAHYCNGELSCAYCGIKDIEVLTIDHINNNGREHRRTLNLHGGVKFYKWLMANRYPPEYQVLCYNCNIKKFRVGQPEAHNISP